MTRNDIGFLAVCLVGGAVIATAFAHRDVPVIPGQVVSELLPSAGSDLIFFLDPVVCNLAAGTVGDLNDFASRTPVRVRAILSSAPIRSDRARVAALFGFEFPVEYDDDGAWASTLSELGFATEAVIWARDGQVRAITRLSDWSAIADQLRGG